MVKKFLVVLVSFLLLCFLLTPLGITLASDQARIEYLITTNRPSWEKLIDTLNQDIYKNYIIPNYYAAQNLRGRQLNKELYTMRCLMVYGTPQDVEGNELKNGRYRFFGQTMNGEAYVNELFPMDAWAGGYLNDRNWVPEPWGKGIVYRGGAIGPTPITYAIESDPALRQKINAAIHTGLTIFYGNKRNAASTNPFDKIYDEARGATTDWAQYVHILQPPTEYTWGMGVMFHRLEGKYWYKTVPIAPFQLSRGDSEKSDTSQSLNLTAKFTKYVTGIPVGEKYTYQATFSNSGRESVQTDIVWRVNGKQVRTKSVTILAQGNVRDELTYTASTASKEGTMTIEVEVNPNRSKPGNETRWDDNKDRISVMVIGVDTGKPGEGEVYLSE